MFYKLFLYVAVARPPDHGLFEIMIFDGAGERSGFNELWPGTNDCNDFHEYSIVNNGVLFIKKLNWLY